MRNHLIKLSRFLELIFCVAFIAIAAVMFAFQKFHLVVLYLILAALLSPLPMMRRLPSSIRFCVVVIGVFL
jgi:hypothetical protein